MKADSLKVTVTSGKAREQLVQTGKEAIQFVKYVANRIVEDRCIESAAALTFTTLLALVPMFTVLYAILAVIPSLREAGDQLQDWMFQHFVPTSGQEIQTYLREFADQASKLTKFGVAFLFVTAIMMMKRIEKSFNLIWRVPEPRKGVIGFMRYWAVLSLGPILVGLGLGITSYVTSLKAVSSAVALLKIQSVGLTVVPFLLSWMAFTLIYLVVPNCPVPIKRSVQGGLIAALAFEIAKRGFTLFVANFGSYQLVYGAFAALPLFLIWLYVSWIILLLGAVATRALTVYRGPTRVMSPILGVICIIYYFWKAQQQGRVVTNQALLSDLPSLSPEEWQVLRERLRDHRIIERTDQDAFLLCTDLNKVTLAQLLSMSGYFIDYRSIYDTSLPLDQATWGDVESGWFAEVKERLVGGHDYLYGQLDKPLGEVFSGGCSKALKIGDDTINNNHS